MLCYTSYFPTMALLTRGVPYNTVPSLVIITSVVQYTQACHICEFLPVVPNKDI